MSAETLQDMLQGITWLSVFVRLSLAALFGGLIGMERGRKRQAAGMRTHMLVCIGAAIVMLTNQYVVDVYQLADPSRLGAQVVSGIGFLGAGTIIVDRRRQVRGLTTAAALWACACMGLAIGIGFYSGAVMGCVFILLATILMDRLEYRMLTAAKYMELYAVFARYTHVLGFRHVLEKSYRVLQFDIIKPHDSTGKNDTRIGVLVILKLPRSTLHEDVLASLNEAGALSLEEVR